MPGLSIVPTGETIVDKGKRYVILRIERDKYSDVNYSTKAKRQYATRP